MKQYPDELKIKAKSLRSQGLTYREICEHLNKKVPKTTLNDWVRHITLPNSYRTKIGNLNCEHLSRVRPLALAKNRKILNTRLDYLHNKNAHLVKNIDKSVAKLILATLYWCEGAKYPSHTGIRFGNSDPNMIRLFITLLRSCYPTTEIKLKLTIQCRADQNIEQLTEFWQKITNIPTTQTYKTQIDKRSKGRPTQKATYKGVCVVEYLNTDLQCELQFLGKSLGSSESILIMKNQIK